MVKKLDRCGFVAGSAGTGDFVFFTAAGGFMSPLDPILSVADGTEFYYIAEDDSDWEIGAGVWTTATETLTRSVYYSSNAHSAVNFAVAPTVRMGAPLSYDFSDLIFSGTNITAPAEQSLYITAGFDDGVFAGEAAIYGGTGNANPGGDAIVQGGSSTDETGGTALLRGGASTNTTGGMGRVFGGDGTDGGGASIAGGSGSTGNGGTVDVNGGLGSQFGGAVNINGGQGSTQNGGNIEIFAGAGEEAGGSVSVYGGDGNASDGGYAEIGGGFGALGGNAGLFGGGGTVSRGGHVILTPGEGATDGGDVLVTLPADTGSGRQGMIIINNLPTADPGVSGALYVDSGVIKMSL